MLATNVSRSQLPADYSTPNKYVVFSRLWEKGINEHAISRFTDLFRSVNLEDMGGLAHLIGELLQYRTPGSTHLGVQGFNGGGLWYVSVQVAPMVESPAGDFDHTSHLTVGVCNDGGIDDYWGTFILNPLGRKGELTFGTRPHLRRPLTERQDAMAYNIARSLL